MNGQGGKLNRRRLVALVMLSAVCPPTRAFAPAALSRARDQPDDPLLAVATRLLFAASQLDASRPVSLVQRHFCIGYRRACALVDAIRYQSGIRDLPHRQNLQSLYTYWRAA